jgi:hypothetical protein
MIRRNERTSEPDNRAPLKELMGRCPEQEVKNHAAYITQRQRIRRQLQELADASRDSGDPY